MKYAGLNEPPTEIECFSVIRALFETDEPDVAIVDIGAESIKLYVTHKGLLMRMHRIRAGGAIVTRELAKMLECTFEEAEVKKFQVQAGDQSFAEIKRAHDNSYVRAFREFNQVLREYERKTGVAIPLVYLSGGGALFPGIDKLLQESLGRDVVLADPFSRVAYPAFMEDTMKELGPSFTVALGAALREFE